MLPNVFIGNDNQYSIDQKLTTMDLFRPVPMMLRTFNLFLQWFSVTMVYYGLLFASTSLSGDPYVNFTLVVLAELPSMFLYLRYFIHTLFFYPPRVTFLKFSSSYKIFQSIDEMIILIFILSYLSMIDIVSYQIKNLNNADFSRK